MKYWIEVMCNTGVQGIVDAPGIRVALIENDQITADICSAIAWANRSVGIDKWDYLNLVSDFTLPDGTLVREFQSKRVVNPTPLSQTSRVTSDEKRIKSAQHKGWA